MRNWMLCSCIALALPCVVCAQQSQGVTPGANTGANKSFAGVPAKDVAPKTKLDIELEAKVRATWEAFKKKDKAAYAKFLTDDFHAVEIDGQGERAARKVLDEVGHSNVADYLLQFFLVQPLGPDYAFVTYESTMKFPKGSVNPLSRVFIGELWTRQSGQWKLMRYQETAVR